MHGYLANSNYWYAISRRDVFNNIFVNIVHCTLVQA